ncbi:MAG: hypothetical protein KFH98_04705 [Gemmatimonadetes bacterium]|nr:hypothetical protein [Gemmatimonadota bacterium]
MQPEDAARMLERHRDAGGRTGWSAAAVKGTSDASERMAGYGLLGLMFESGHVLAFRRFTASSIGPPYVSIWHRRPDGRWFIHTNVEPARACPRYFGPALHGYHVDEIDIAWKGPAELSISAVHARIHLALRLEGSALTRLLGAASRAAPGALLEHRRSGVVAGRILGAGRMTLAGVAPAGQEFVIRPSAVWRVAAAAAVIDGREAGAVITAVDQAALGTFAIPARGLFATGRVEFRTLAPAARVFP